MRAMRGWIVVLGVLVCVGGAGCATGAETSAVTTAARARSSVEVAPTPLLPPSAIDYDFQWRQHVTARWPTGTQSFEAVLQKRAGELILMGLSPLGMPGFVFRLDAAGELTVQNKTGEPLAFEPAYVVADVQRVFFPWLPKPPADYSGERSGQHGASTITERYELGRLMERRFARDTSRGRERVVITYGYDSQVEPPSDRSDAPARASLENTLLGYGLSVETIEQTRL